MAGLYVGWPGYCSRMASEVEKLACELIEIESVNPDLVPAGGGEGRIADFVASWLTGAGLEVEILEAVSGRPSAVGIARGAGGGPSLMLNAHMDTVGAGGMTDPFRAVVQGGRIYGRGAYDMKGALAAIMVAAKQACGLGLAGDVIVAAVADEEVASFGTASVIERFRAASAIVTESTELRLCLAHRGFAWLEVEVRGVAAHGSRPELGVDAIAHAGRILTGVAALDDRLREGKRHPLVGTGSVHASAIEGGGEMSTYPDRCTVKIERRTIPGENGQTGLGEIEALIADARHHDPRLEASARLLLERAPSELGADHPVAVALGSAGRAETGRVEAAIGVPYWMDMALLNTAGIPTACFGPAGAGAHADVEWVDIASLETCVRVYLRAAQALCGKVR
jgi:acetylornithine deacetylase